MLRISQLKLPPDHSREELDHMIRKTLRLPKEQKVSYEIVRQSIDARKKPDIFYVYTVEVSCAQENRVLKNCRNKNVTAIQPMEYRFPVKGTQPLSLPPVIVGTGPAGLFCGLMLARAGFCPILLERGEAVESRRKTVEKFWNTGTLNPESNVQFGEGGAGTFSDGKLNTMVKDSQGRIRFVLKNFIRAGANPDILYSAKPHIGTDVLMQVVKNIREEILSLGGQVRFTTRLSDIEPLENGRYSLRLEHREGNFAETLKTQLLILAIGHSSRDTFRMLFQRRFELQPKAFAVGVRVEHPQSMVNQAMYGENCPYPMPPAPYKLTHKLADGRGVYSFCMCPGGYVVNASSEPEMLAVNGMSYHARDSRNANSAIVVTVSPEDFGGKGPLDGLAFQQRLERNAYRAGQGKIPLQRFEDYQAGRPTKELGKIHPEMKGAYALANVRSIFPEPISASIEEGILAFERQIPGFSQGDVLLSGVESRTSSPVRILRNEACESNHPGIYPCGEGAGYAGGITSAAMDGIRVAEAIAGRYYGLR